MIKFSYMVGLLMNLIAVFANDQHNSPLYVKGDTLKVKHTTDFEIKGDGSAVNWNSTEWLRLPKSTDAGISYQSQVKMLYSDSGIYCLYRCEDKKITATI